MKIHATDIVRILKTFGRADENIVPRQIERIEVSNPSATNTMAKFRYHKNNYYVLFDDDAEDNTEYLLSELHIIAPNTPGMFIENSSADIHTYGHPYEGKDCYLFIEESGKVRLDTYLAEHYTEYSRSSWQKYIKQECIRVNGETITKPRHEINTNDTVDVSLPAAEDHSEQSLPIIHEDEHVIVIDKPAGVLTHRRNPTDTEFTIAEFMRTRVTDITDTERPGIVHRLDRDTSGVIICAKTQAAHDVLKEQFADRTVKKTYYAVTERAPKQPAAKIDAPIARNLSKPGSFCVHANGKSAQTVYHTERIGEKQHAHLLVTPRTGRTHQIRVHLAYIHCPIVGDPVYGSSDTRLMLHAHKITIKLPHQTDAITFVSAVPPELIEA